ncbi:rubredoxin [Methanobacterium formicicum]|uniref:Rubredoxin n=1 Tax=Methanobacterium formicicum TaxID=2162 RepID=A0A843AWN4_METFO|nr:rubredoxin [Methanobacterium formicicum]MBF4475105.1 rubredoxin [Methanobacterium formicicum]
MNYQCEICHYIYEPENGDPESGVDPGTPFNELPGDWLCPRCGIDKSSFEMAGSDAKIPKGKDPLLIMVQGLTQGLWTICWKWILFSDPSNWSNLPGRTEIQGI